MADSIIKNPGAAFGQAKTTISSATAVADMVAESAVTAGSLVALTGTAASSGNVIPAATGTAPERVIGVALETRAAGQVVQVAVLGPVFNVKTEASAAIALGDRLTRSGTTAGGVVTLANATGVTTVAGLGQVVGIAMSAAANNLVDMFVVKY